MAKKQTNIGSIVTGILLGVIVSWWIFGDYDVPVVIGSMAVGVAAFGTLAAKRPRFVEILAYAVSVYILFQAAWDYRLGDWTPDRSVLSSLAVVMLAVNVISGYVGASGAKNAVINQMGLGKR